MSKGKWSHKVARDNLNFCTNPQRFPSFGLNLSVSSLPVTLYNVNINRIVGLSLIDQNLITQQALVTLECILERDFFFKLQQVALAKNKKTNLLQNQSHNRNYAPQSQVSSLPQIHIPHTSASL